MIVTFIDSGVLVAASRGVEDLSDKAITILTSGDREFASSQFIRLEVLPKAVYNRQTDEFVSLVNPVLFEPPFPPEGAVSIVRSLPSKVKPWSIIIYCLHQMHNRYNSTIIKIAELMMSR